MAPQHQDSSQRTNFTASKAEPVFDDDTCLLQEEFRRFLEKSGFVEEVTDFYINKERRLLAENSSDTDSHHPSGRHNTGKWQQLVRTSLPAWLFWLTYIMRAQAKLVEEDRPLSRAQLAALFSDRLFHQNQDDLLF